MLAQGRGSITSKAAPKLQPKIQSTNTKQQSPTVGGQFHQEWHGV